MTEVTPIRQPMTPAQEAAARRISPALQLLVQIKNLELEVMQIVLAMHPSLSQPDAPKDPEARYRMPAQPGEMEDVAARLLALQQTLRDGFDTDFRRALNACFAHAPDVGKTGPDRDTWIQRQEVRFRQKRRADREARYAS